MRRNAWIFAILLGIAVNSEARQSWDVGVTAGSFGSSPATPEPAYGDDWYFDGRYAVSLGRYWSTHLKTEIEFATTGEGERYANHFANVPGVPPQHPIYSNEYYRLQQASGRVVWQFLENAWAHPYVFGGASLDIERRRTEIPEQFYLGSSAPFNPANRILITPAMEIGPETEFRPAGVLGAGAKLYMTPRSYFNAAVIGSLAKSSGTISFVGGFGLDF